jgi:hypothetical protein
VVPGALALRVPRLPSVQAAREERPGPAPRARQGQPELPERQRPCRTKTQEARAVPAAPAARIVLQVPAELQKPVVQPALEAPVVQAVPQAPMDPGRPPA